MRIVFLILNVRPDRFGIAVTVCADKIGYTQDSVKIRQIRKKRDTASNPGCKEILVVNAVLAVFRLRLIFFGFFFFLMISHRPRVIFIRNVDFT